MNVKSRIERAIGITLILVLALTPLCLGQRRSPKKTKVKNHIMYTMLEPGEIPAIFEPEFLPAIKAEKFFFPNEPLIVVTDGKTAKAYSTWHLDAHEVVNDFINGKAIAVTW